MAKKRKNLFLRKYFLIICSIVALNFMGISYAALNENLDIVTNITTGDIEPYFFDAYNLEKIRGDGKLNIRFEDDHTMVVDGEVSPKYKAFLHYGVLNKGNIPVKFANQHQKIDEGLILQLNQQSGILIPSEHFYSETGDPKLHIQADQAGTYEFEIELIYAQFNQPY